MPLDEITDRLLASESVASLQAEQEVVAAFKRMEWWEVEHGPLYQDLDTGKLRELDVRATRSFMQGRDEMPVSLQVLVELKRMRDFHLVFARSPDERESTPAQVAWVGRSRDSLRRCLIEHRVPATTVSDVLSRFDHLAFPSEGDPRHVLMPTTAPLISTAFRETNVGGQKELDASVLWKAIQALTSCIAAARTKAETFYLGDVPYVVEAARNDETDLAEAIEQLVAPIMSRWEVFHPVFVTDARLWLSRDCALTEVDHIRFKARDPGNPPTRWFDIVSRRSFATWIEALTQHYRLVLQHPAEAAIRRRAAAIATMFDALTDVIHNPALDLRMQIRDRDSGTIKRMRLVRMRSESTA